MPQDGDTVRVCLDRSGGWDTERGFRFGPETDPKPSDGGLPILGPQSPMRRALIESLEEGKKSGSFTCECGTGERERKIKLVRIIRAGAH